MIGSGKHESNVEENAKKNYAIVWIGNVCAKWIDLSQWQQQTFMKWNEMWGDHKHWEWKRV